MAGRGEVRLLCSAQGTSEREQKLRISARPGGKGAG